jgi:hypothetical protein
MAEQIDSMLELEVANTRLALSMFNGGMVSHEAMAAQLRKVAAMVDEERELIDAESEGFTVSVVVVREGSITEYQDALAHFVRSMV